jgi:hypothetical protein
MTDRGESSRRVPHFHTHRAGPEIARLNATAQLSRLLPELVRWRGELAGDIQRAELRAFREFAGDLRALARRVDAVLEAARG